MNKIATIILAAAFAVCPIIDLANAAGSEAADNVQFTDIQGHWAEEAVKTAVSKGIIAGYPDGSFLPDHEVSRAEAAAMLNRLTKQSANPEPKAFPDIEQHWGRESIRQLVASGFIAESDYPGGFEPDLKLTRYEMMKWLANGLANSEESFKQALQDTANTLLPTLESFAGGIAPEQTPYIAIVKGTGIVDGFPDGSFRPQATTTRAELIAILLRYESVKGRSADQFQALNELREVGLTGTNVTSISPFRYAQIKDKDEKGRFKKEYISFIGIYLNDKTDYKAMEPFLQNPDVVVRYTDGKDPGNQRFEKFSSLKMSLRDAAFKGMNAGEIVYMGLQNPKTISDEEMERYMADPNVHILVDRSAIPYTNFSHVTGQPIQMGDVAELQLHRMLFIPAGGIVEQGAVSVYSSLFEAGHLTQGISRYMVLIESTIHMAKDTDLLTLLNAEGKALGNPLLSLSRITEEMARKSRLPVMPQRAKEFLKQGAINRFWSYASFPTDKYNSFGLTTDSGTYFYMNKP